MSTHGHKPSSSVQNYKAHLATAYNELGKELSSHKIRVVGNYTLSKVIGEGAYGKVRLGTHRLTSTKVAVKQIPKAMSASLTREIHHHRALHHPHVVQLYEIIATENSIWLVAELCSGGELFDYLVEKGRLGEQETKVIFGQLCLAVAYIHEKGIVHRDLKLENVLLDERCRVKLSDFGFTREFERGGLLDTFCGTTGYAAPEMLQAQRYLGPEVDIWSLGIVLYTLLTGTLPFDDDDEGVMREKIIQGEYDDPEWLSEESRDLIRNILQKDPGKRLSIAQILGHAWFTTPAPTPEDIIPAATPTTSIPIPLTPLRIDQTPEAGSEPSSGSAVSSSSFKSASSSPWPSTPTTPDEPAPPVTDAASERTLTRTSVRPAPSPPAFHPTRTPARGKRRSASSALSETISLPEAPVLARAPDFGALLATPAPLLFSTALERELLSGASALGLDTAQMVHSVLTDACDAAGATWWMLKRKAERRAVEAGDGGKLQVSESLEGTTDVSTPVPARRKSKRVEATVSLPPTQSAPELTILPATPTVTSNPRIPSPPPVDETSSSAPYLSPTPSMTTVSVSSPTTPGGGAKDTGSKGRRDSKLRTRSGSASIMQRATTALEAAGLVRKKSAEVIKEKEERERERQQQASSEDTRSSHASSSKLTKSPPMKAMKDALLPSTPSLDADSHRPGSSSMGSPWVVAGQSRKDASPGSSRGGTPTASPGDTLSSLPNVNAHGGKLEAPRSRASLLSAFRMWFNEDRKAKRKSAALAAQNAPGGRGDIPYARSTSAPGIPVSSSRTGTMKRRASGSGNVPTISRGAKNRAKRVSMGSRRSSSINSRRSSITSTHMVVLDSGDPHHAMPAISRQVSNGSRRSVGANTPNSERGDYPSRPSSVHSDHRHRKSPSNSSVGSAHRNTSPLPKYHRRGGSSSSSRVVRQVQSPHHSKSSRPPHARSGSATSMHSLASSRANSLYDLSEAEGRNSPLRSYPRRSLEDSTPRRGSGGGIAFASQKRHTTFSPTFTRSSWKKSWGAEPPGWQSRTPHLPIEVLAISPPNGDGPMALRDVFSGRPSVIIGDESDWVDEDDDVPAFIGGLGQLPAGAPGTSGVAGTKSTFGQEPAAQPYILSAPPKPKNGRGAGQGGKRTNRNNGYGSAGVSSSSRLKTGSTPVGRSSPLPTPDESTDARNTRRQPIGRPTQSFRDHPIEEEEEEEE